MVEEDINVADEFEIGKEKVSVFLLSQTFDESVLDEVNFFLLLHAQKNNNQSNFSYWKYSRFDSVLLDDEVCFSYSRFTKKNISYFCHVFGVLIP